MKAFKPVEVYPCTIDGDYLDLSVSVASLFGHLCFGTSFTHDQEMELLANQRETLKRGTDGLDSQSMPSSDEASVNQQGTNPVPSVLGSASDPEAHYLNSLNRLPKRTRTSASFLQSQEGNLHLSLPTGDLSPRQQIPRLKQSFQNYVAQSKREDLLATSKTTNLASNQVSSYIGSSETTINRHQWPFTEAHLRKTPSANTVRNERFPTRPVDEHPGTQAEPIDLSDGDPSSQANEEANFLLEEIPEPNDVPGVIFETQSGPDTQVTISDTAFESQSPHDSAPDSRTVRLEKRKEAYKAAKESNGIWGVDHGLISSNAHHGDAEIEL